MLLYEFHSKVTRFWYTLYHVSACNWHQNTIFSRFTSTPHDCRRHHDTHRKLCGIFVPHYDVIFKTLLYLHSTAFMSHFSHMRWCMRAIFLSLVVSKNKHRWEEKFRHEKNANEPQLQFSLFEYVTCIEIKINKIVHSSFGQRVSISFTSHCSSVACQRARNFLFV